jgi:putative membrane protein
VLFALIHCATLEGFRRTALFFAISAVVSYAFEEIGVRTGLIYGHYHYSNMLGPKLGSVPIIIPLAWFMMIYPSWRVAQVLIRGTDTHSFSGRTAQAFIAALVMTAWDMVMDPGNAAAGIWVWEHGGVYFGVPRQNYFGWVLTTFLIYWAASWFWRQTGKRASAKRKFLALPIIVYTFYAIRYIAADRIPALRLIALFTMGTLGLLALTQVFLSRETSALSGSSLSLDGSNGY